MDDILRRLGTVESAVFEVREQVSGIAATIPHLATKADLSEIREQVSGIAAAIPHLATKADVRAVETSIIKWLVPTAIAIAGLAFSIAKFVH